MRRLAIVSSLALAAALLPSGAVARTISIPFSAANFSDPLTIDNSYFPLVAGTTYTYKAETPDGCEVDVVVVTYDTRSLDGVTTRVVHDQGTLAQRHAFYLCGIGGTPPFGTRFLP